MTPDPLSWTELLTKEITLGIPEGYESTEQIAAKLQIPKRAAYRRLYALRDKGLVQSLYSSHNGYKTCVWKFE
tara:strand:- start:46 stop:264 length:219 start_codon:yes stop_codon:yes gene_type:complete